MTGTAYESRHEPESASSPMSGFPTIQDTDWAPTT